MSKFIRPSIGITLSEQTLVNLFSEMNPPSTGEVEELAKQYFSMLIEEIVENGEFHEWIELEWMEESDLG